MTTLKDDCALIADILDEWRIATPAVKEQVMKMLREAVLKPEAAERRLRDARDR